MSGSTAASCQAVMPRRCRWAWPRSMAAPTRPGRARGEVADQGLGRLVEGAGRLAGGVPLDPAPRRVGGGAGDPGQLQGEAVDPGAVAVGGLQQHRPVGDHRVQRRPVGAAGAEGVHDPAAAEDPGVAGVVGGVAGHGGGVRRRLDLVEVALGQLQAAGGGVDVRVLEPGQDQPAVQAQHPGRRSAQLGQVALGPAAATRPARTATASAQGRAGSACTGAPTMSRSASAVMAAPR